MFQTVTAWDWFVWAVMVASVGVGWLRGFLTTGFALVSWAIAVLAVPLLAPWAVGRAPDSMPVGMVCFVLFGLLLLGSGILSRIAARALAGFHLGGLDRAVGGVLGGVRALILVMVVAIPAHFAGLSSGGAWQASHMRSVLDGLVDWAGPFVPARDDEFGAH
jgi:membrane protein required for colicin V production